MKQLKKIQHQQQIKIFEAMTKLKDSETWGDVKALKNYEYDYRQDGSVIETVNHIKKI